MHRLTRAEPAGLPASSGSMRWQQCWRRCSGCGATCAACRALVHSWFASNCRGFKACLLEHIGLEGVDGKDVTAVYAFKAYVLKQASLEAPAIAGKPAVHKSTAGSTGGAAATTKLLTSSHLGSRSSTLVSRPGAWNCCAAPRRLLRLALSARLRGRCSAPSGPSHSLTLSTKVPPQRTTCHRPAGARARLQGRPTSPEVCCDSQQHRAAEAPALTHASLLAPALLTGLHRMCILHC